MMIIDTFYPGLGAVLPQIPGWSPAENLQVELLAGLTNRNYAVTVNGERLVVRISRENAAALGIDRELEVEALTAASQVCIGPELVRAILPEGHLVTRYIEGHENLPKVDRNSSLSWLCSKSISLGFWPKTFAYSRRLPRSS